ncbi:hypothetical protein ABZ793_12315 [Micromonospora sp. NPDC047465]|uniref:hypothetical protein n=1 Tax=Micromonospora sp. NPDC047465 TaxID=3154813 RepID=UPI0033DF7EB2
MEYRADLYAAGAQFQRTERYVARHETEAIDAARQMVVALGLDYAEVYISDGHGRAQHVAMVGAER